MALVGSLGALVLSLFITSGKTYHERQANELRQISVKMLLLGQILQLYGPEAIPALPEKLFDQIAGLKPKEDQQRFIQSQASSLLLNLGELRWLSVEETAVRINPLVVIVLDFWLTCIVLSW